MADEAAARLGFQMSLPAKRMGSGAVIRDDEGRVLLVNAAYKDTWELPGGVVEAGESPASACRREVLEELGLEVEVGEMACVDYNRSAADYVESLMFLFEVPNLTPRQEENIVLQPDEISEWRYCGSHRGERSPRRSCRSSPDGCHRWTPAEEGPPPRGSATHH